MIGIESKCIIRIDISFQTKTNLKHIKILLYFYYITTETKLKFFSHI